MNLATVDPAEQTREGAATMPIQQLGNERTTAYTEGSELVMEREFDAPRDLVWKVLTDSRHIANWWGPYGHTMTVEEMDVRPGGRWRWIGHTPDGRDVPFTGEYLEVDAPERYVRTEIYDVEPFNLDPAAAAVETLVLEDLGGRTRLVSRSTFPSQEILAGALSSGMIGGALESYDRLGEEVARLA
jgi:uncharacterized protein YndB with AHSA1/START domain